MQEWLTVNEICRYLKLDRRTVYRLMEDGRLPYYVLKGSGRRRIKREDVEALLVPAPEEEAARTRERATS